MGKTRLVPIPVTKQVKDLLRTVAEEKGFTKGPKYHKVPNYTKIITYLVMSYYGK